ncbi:MAG: STAS-like domain-containing protein [Bacteroidales bacterium]|nr:STAS-like domain-containing protein [Bacteroidales bacterium]
MKTTIFYFKDINENLGTRQLGKEVREKLIPIIDENDKTIFDFTNVNVVSNSFADECFAKLLLNYSLSQLKQKTTFVGLNDFAKKNISIAFKRRAQFLSCLS